MLSASCISTGSEYYFLCCFRTTSSFSGSSMDTTVENWYPGQLQWAAAQWLSFRAMDSASDSPVDNTMWNQDQGQSQWQSRGQHDVEPEPRTEPGTNTEPLWPTWSSHGTTDSASPWTSAPRTAPLCALHSGCSRQRWSRLCWQCGPGGFCAFISTHTLPCILKPNPARTPSCGLYRHK